MENDGLADAQTRIGSFASQGRQGNVGLSPGLREATARQNAAVARTFTPTSVLNQFGPSLVRANASAPGMKDRVLMGNQIAPNVNAGSSSETAQSAMLLRMQGKEYE